MNLRESARAFPTMMRVSLAEAVAYRAEMFIWILSTTMPLVMMPLWLAVTRNGPVQGMSGTDVVAYFLATFIVRQLTSSWAAWQLNFEVRTGVLSMRLLRPVHPIWAYAIEHFASIPLRIAIALPLAVTILLALARQSLPHDAVSWLLFFVALAGAWTLTFAVQVMIGALSLFMQSSLKIMDVWVVCFFVFSGYLIPLRMFPPALRAATDYLPFRYQISLPVELLTSSLSREQALALIGHQWIYVVACSLLCAWTWTRGMKRFAAYGG